MLIRLQYFILVCSLGMCCLFASCNNKQQREVVVYTSVDQPIAAPILRDFEKQHGIHVVVLTDSEATKSAGLSERLLAEKDHPQSDVWWSNEAFRTISLASQGVLAPYRSPSATDIPQEFKDTDHYWAGAGLRVRVIAVSDSIPKNVPVPEHLSDLGNPIFKKRIAIARPTAGTTGSFVAALYLLWGDQQADLFFHKLHDNGIALVGGNSVVADYVGQGQFWAGLTDNDDVANAQANELKLHSVLPDQDSFGTLPIPGSVALVAGAQHPVEAKELIDYLLSSDVEHKLVAAHSAAWSVRDKSRTANFMVLDFKKIAAMMPSAVNRATSILEGR